MFERTKFNVAKRIAKSKNATPDLVMKVALVEEACDLYDRIGAVVNTALETNDFKCIEDARELLKQVDEKLCS